ncbi:diguanylate cyclase [Pseudocolwellia sp. AS88]|uniref:GGDEF domain-containing response regulator n=1 Tax=Pseudocolwellia sp. AS88 TaxID=3063958 RepID=UPI0026ECDD12|nr:diguanylate cyclase [Pseudocolwellia sp. AS88]MDO7085224.1 diguanylate cyclase [Pseudocolwellia sp. AS88]
MKTVKEANNKVHHLASAKNNLHLVTRVKENLTILLVHEYDNQLAHWVDIFKHDYSIKIAHDAVTALKIVLDENIDLVLSSVQLSDMSGLDVCKFVKQHITTKDIQVMFVSDHYNEYEEEQAIELGAIDYISCETPSNILFNRVKNQMKLIQRSHELEHVSRTDSLTGIANRMRFDLQLKEDWTTAIRGESPISLIMIDIDHFKLYNDEFGHVKGDECLTLIAQTISRSNFRSKDLVARFGGEEFVILLPFTDLAGAEKIAHDVIEAISSLNIKSAAKASQRMVTISAGVTSFSPTYKKKADFTATELLKAADAKLYQAKKNGRNQYAS